jgi:succinate-acetate transporter protein
MSNGRAPGDPQLIGVPVFCTGSIALALQLTGYVGDGATSLGSPIAIILGLTGLFLLVAALWAAAEGQSWPAGFFALFGGFWISYGFFVLGVINDWYGFNAAIEADPEAGVQDLTRTVAIFAIAFATIFFFLFISSLKLPAAYGLVIILVVAALCFVAAAYLTTPVDTDMLNVAGYIAFVFAGVGMWIYLCVSIVSLGGKPLPLGPVPWPNKE